MKFVCESKGCVPVLALSDSSADEPMLSVAEYKGIVNKVSGEILFDDKTIGSIFSAKELIEKSEFERVIYMNEELYNLGFYICRIEDTPKYLNGISSKLISPSECLCTHEPQICLCHGWKPNGDNVEYMKKLGLTLKQYIDYSNEIQNLFENGRYFIDGRFSNEEDAKYFYCKYFNNQQFILISFATEYEYYAALIDNGFFRQSKQLVSVKETQILGCDIIGFDIDSFHSFLCNSLQERFKNISFSEYGLIDLDFLTVKEMCKNIQGLGEPVDWIPVIVFGQLQTLLY